MSVDCPSTRAYREVVKHLLPLLLTACVDTGGPSMTFCIQADPGDPDVEVYRQGARAWAEIGIAEDPASPVVVWFQRDPLLKERTGHWAMSDRGTDVVTIDSELRGFNLYVAAAHEVGHIVLDTPRHTSCGVMAGLDVALCDEDRALACSTVGLGC